MKDNVIRMAVCPLCGRTYHGAPALSREDNETLICPDCGKPLLIRQGTNAKGPWTMFSCSGFPQCKASFWDKDGKPNFNNRVKH